MRFEPLTPTFADRMTTILHMSIFTARRSARLKGLPFKTLIFGRFWSKRHSSGKRIERHELRHELRHRLRHGLRHKLRHELRQELRHGLRHELRHGLRHELRHELQHFLQRFT